MVSIPENVKALFNDKDACKIIATACKDGKPHAIPAGTIGVFDDSTMVAVQIFMDVFVKNIESNPKAAFTVAKRMEAYIVNTELKAKLFNGPIYDMMSNKIQEMLHLPIKSVLLFDIKSVYDQSASPNAGKKLA
ncbi:MAG: pyridoxamine 5'-phosphate oxidase family protein [Candidatus Methanomethylophilaceae archaeon]|nr:pyridoxamine 5'-phosphate oxidase family protein [Candidatus Methanomethylophilaceae archaeon]